MNALQYEMFLRIAFCVKHRGDDPAHISDADIHNMAYDLNYLNKVKAGTAYAIAIFSHRFIEMGYIMKTEDEEMLNTFLGEAINANTIQEIDDVISRCRAFLEGHGVYDSNVN
jgi:hypothetical protein